ncbi:MAG: 50S ribosomal protein L4 [Dehalococcoidia bacterium]|jgi:large subunit ribosomal protein L4|nr:50S ribosomal protein L4 [Dehalococcoidia bacterium]
MKLNVTDAAGKKLTAIDVDDAVFGIEPNEAVVHQTLVAQLAARRSGSANTKSRGQVRGSTRKIRRQKGLGMARMGSNRSPLRRGGGVAFGPSQRSYAKKLPKRMRRLAIRSVLASRVAEERLAVVDELAIAEPSTKAIVSLLESIEIGRSALIVTAESDRAALLSARNVSGVGVTPADTLNVADMLAHRTLVLTTAAVRRIEELWGGERASGRPRPQPVAAEG